MKKTPPVSSAGSPLSLAMLGVCLLLATALSVSAANLTWNGGGANANWNNSANWFGVGTPANGDTLIFSGAVRLLNTNNIAGLTLNQIRFVGPSGGFDIRGNAFTLTNNIEATNFVGANTIENNITLANVNQLLDVTVSLTLSGILSGNAGTIKNGSGTLVLSSANTYSGNTIISAGTLTLSGAGAINSSPSVSVLSGATFNVLAGGYTVSAGHTLTGAGSVLSGTVTVASGGILTPGDAGTGLLTMFALSLSSGATNNFEFAGTGTNDLVIATNLTLNGGAINLYQIGTTTPFTTLGTYNLFQHSGAVGGTGIGALTVANPQSGYTYTFGDTGTNVTVNIASNTPSAAATYITVRSVDGSIIGVRFSQPVDDVTATDTGNYEVFSKGAGSSVFNVTNALLMSDSQTVALFLDQPVGEFFAVGVSNVLDINGSNVTDTATGYLGDQNNANIGDASDPDPAGQVISFFRNVFQVTTGGSDIGDTSDHCHFVYTKASGNFELVAQVTRLDFSDTEAKACLMARESTATGSRMVAFGCTPVVPGVGTNRFFTLVRSSGNGNATNFGNPSQLNSLTWMRMTRTNNTFTVYYSTNSGGNWTAAGSTSQALSGTLSLGVAVASHTNGRPTTAVIKNFGVLGARPGASVLPTLSVNIVSNKLVAKWQRTPEDFALQVTDTLTPSSGGTGGGGSNSVPSNWAHLMFPTFDTSLTGTNGYMPTPGRYMTIPLNLFSNSAMFVRLTKVERVIPDPINITPGIVLSQAAQNIFTTNSAQTLGGFGIYTNTALAATNGTYLICPAGSSYEFSTATTGDPVRTVLQMRKYNNLNAFPANPGSLTDYKGKITFGTSISTTNYTFVVASTNAAAYKSSDLNPIIITIIIK